jgi:hypothetical protein
MRLVGLHFNFAFQFRNSGSLSIVTNVSAIIVEVCTIFGSVAAEATGRSPVMLQRLEKRICQRMPTLCKRLHALETKAEALVCVCKRAEGLEREAHKARPSSCLPVFLLRPLN